MEFLEWIPFIGSLWSIYLYGKSPLYGPLSGIIVSILFLLLSLQINLYAMFYTNLIFLLLHLKNWRTYMKTDIERWKRRTAKGINDLVYKCFRASYDAGWWHDTQGNPLLVPDDPTRGVKRTPIHEFVIPTKLCLKHSETSEAMEGDRKTLMDDKLPHRSMLEVELADDTIRSFDIAGALGLDLGGAIVEKTSFNLIRPDHKVENRRKANGKKY